LSQSPPKPQHAANSSSLSRCRQRFRTAILPPKWENAGAELIEIAPACRSRGFAKSLAGKGCHMLLNDLSDLLRDLRPQLLIQ
jgi:hypothetical protein